MIRPTFLGFDTAKRGIMTSQKGLDITGQNLVNWDSTGYTRQRVEQVAVAPNTYSSRYGNNRIGVAGQGVDISGVSQIRDKFLDKRFREQQADTAYYSQVSNMLGDLESTIDELQPLSESGIRAMLSNIFGALQSFSEDASSETHANIVMSSFKSLSQTLNQLSEKLDNVSEQYKFDLGVSVDELNQKFQELAGLNEAISSDINSDISNSRYGPNELLDARNQLLDELSAYADLDVTENADGTVTVKMGGHKVVDGKKYDTLRMNENNNGTVSLLWVSTNDKLSSLTGSLKAATDYINGRGPNMASEGETIQKGIPYYKDQLDTFADTLVKTVNSIIPEVDADGNEILDANGNKVYKKLLGARSDTPDANGQYPVSDKGSITAANISISDEWNKDSSYIIYKGGSTENNYILKLLTALRDEQQTFPSRGGEEFTGTFNDFVVGYSTTLATDKAYYDSRLTATANLSVELQDRRDEVSGVVVDEEVANIMLYQKSLQAASRLMTTLDEALDVLINKTGLVGR